MSRTTLCVLTAAGLVTASAALMAGRYHVLGDEVLVPRGPGTWKVTLKVTGKAVGPRARLMTITPLDFDRQHIHCETFESAELFGKPPTARHPERRQVYWLPRAGVRQASFAALYEFYCDTDVRRPSAAMAQLTKAVYAPPQRGAHLESQSLIESDAAAITALARRLVEGRDGAYDRMEALFQFVDRQIGNDPSVGARGLSAAECWTRGRGDSRSKSRLLVALCRNRGIPARLVTGLALRRGHEQTSHAWVEAWVKDHWRPLCPFYHHFGHVPSTYLVFGFGDLPIVRGRDLTDLDYAFLVDHSEPDELTAGAEPAGGSRLRATLKRWSPDALPGPERRLVEFLLLIPIAGLIVCVYRNVIGLNSFGTFAPALVGLAFRDLHSMPGILVFTSIVLLGWGMRRVLDRFHLLQVPRTAVMLSLVVMLLVLLVIAANSHRLAATKYVPLFPIVILTGMVERFWTLEVEDGAGSSFRTLVGTLVIAFSIALVLSWESLVNHMLRFPETLGAIVAAQLLIGRYTGYRLSELLRFRDFLIADAPSAMS